MLAKKGTSLGLPAASYQKVIDPLSAVLSLMLFRILFIQNCWVFWGEVRRDLENARH